MRELCEGATSQVKLLFQQGCGKAKHVIGKDSRVEGQTKEITAHPTVVMVNNSQSTIVSRAERLVKKGRSFIQRLAQTGEERREGMGEKKASKILEELE